MAEEIADWQRKSQVNKPHDIENSQFVREAEKASEIWNWNEFFGASRVIISAGEGQEEQKKTA